MRLRDLPDEVNKVSGHVLDAAIKVHTALGPGLLENVYKWCLCHELSERGFRVEREVPANVQYGSLFLPRAYFADIVVEDLVVVEAKTYETILPVHEAQLMTYVRLLDKPLGILLNFHAARIYSEEGFRRRANQTKDCQRCR